MAYSMAMHAFRTIQVSLLLTMLVGCGRTVDPPVTTTQLPITTTTDAVSPTSSSEEPEIAELEATGENLPPGAYTRSNFEPGIHLEVDGSWEAVQIKDGFSTSRRGLALPTS